MRGYLFYSISSLAASGWSPKYTETATDWDDDWDDDYHLPGILHCLATSFCILA